MLCFSGPAHKTWRSGSNYNVNLAFLPVSFDCPLSLARKGQATSELPEWLSAFVSTTQSHIEASRDQAERSEWNIMALLTKLDQQEEHHEDSAVSLQQQLAQATTATPLQGHLAPHQAAQRPLHRQRSPRPISLSLSLSGNFGNGVQRGRISSSCPMAND